MYAPAPHVPVVESYYPPDQLVTAGPGRRLGAYLLEIVISLLTLFIGWFVWFCIVAPRGQTPGKQLLGLYIMRADGTRAGGGYTWLREVLVKGVLFGGIISTIFFPAWLVSAAWCLWDKDRQCLWDKVTETYVAWSPQGYRPSTADELRR
ncbi:MAG TPA: RDD family protein, partial [Dehalococcoidia bacterium]